VQKQLLGRGTVGPRVVLGPDVSPLWQFFLMPPSQNSILIYNDGTVVERQTFENSDIQDVSVHTFILGGADFRTTEGSFEYDSLTAAGYTWRDIPEWDTYGGDYDSTYSDGR
jgi:hypothetical protein